MPDPRVLLEPLLELHAHVRERVVAATERQHVEALAAIDRDEPGDTIYAIDVVGEEIITEFAKRLAREHSFVLVGEGLPGRGTPEGAPYSSNDGSNEGRNAADWVIIVDPI